MIHTSLILLAASAAVQPEPQTRLATLESLLAPLAKEAGYGLSMTSQLAGRPLVYYFATEQEPMDRITDVAERLDLQVIRSEENKLLTITRSPKLRTQSFRERVQQSVLLLKNRLQPYASLPPEQMYYEGHNLHTLSLTNPYKEEAKNQSETSELLRSAAQPLGALSLLPILEGAPSSLAGILSKSATAKNRLTFSVSANHLLDQFSSRQITPLDRMLDKSRFSEKDWEHVTLLTQVQREALTEVPESAVLVFTHGISQNGVVIFLKAISPATEFHLEAVQLELAQEGASAPPRQDPIAGWDKNFTARLPFFGGSNGANINSLGMAAIPLGKNYVGWFGTAPFPQTNNQTISLQEHLTRPLSRVMQVWGTVEGDWLILREYLSLWTEYAADWRTFEKLVPLVNGPATRSEWQAQLEPLTENDFVELERVMSDFSTASPSEDFWAATGGSRLLRAALREMEATGQTKFRAPLSQLSPLARNDAVAFFDGFWLWNYAGWVLHPENLKKRDRAVLYGEVRQEDGRSVLAFGLDFPPDQFTFRRPAQTDFKIPIKADL